MYCFLGKTTTINMLTGLLPPDATSGDATIYGSSVLQNMDNIRRSVNLSRTAFTFS